MFVKRGPGSTGRGRLEVNCIRPRGREQHTADFRAVWVTEHGGFSSPGAVVCCVWSSLPAQSASAMGSTPALTHASAPFTLSCPSAHATHSTAAPTPYRPAEHCAHPVLPAPEVARPTAHGKHSEAPWAAWYRPGAHAEHRIAPLPLTWPGGQGVHLTAPVDAPLKRPAAHCAQRLDPVPLAARPTSHSRSPRPRQREK